MSLSRAGVMSCDEEQVCLMIKQVQVKAISDGGYGPFSNRCISRFPHWGPKNVHKVNIYCITILVESFGLHNI